MKVKTGNTLNQTIDFALVSSTSSDGETPSEFIQTAQALSKKIFCIEQNISEIRSRFDPLTKDISCHHEILYNDISTSFGKLERGIDLIQENIDNLKSNFRDLEKKNSPSSETTDSSDSTKKQIKLTSKARSRWNKAINAVRVVSRREKIVFLEASFTLPEIDIISKSEEDKIFIKEAIKKSEYCKNRICYDEELTHLVDAMDLAKFKANSIIVSQGSDLQKSNISIVRTGIVDVFKDGIHISTMKSKKILLTFYMVGTVNSYEFRARTDCELYIIPSLLFHQITTYYGKSSPEQKSLFFQSVNFGEKCLGDLLNTSAISELSSASKEKTYKEGDVIMKEGEMTSYIYFIQQGTVHLFTKAFGSSPLKQLSGRDFFGQISMLMNATCIVASPVMKCLVLERDVFSRAIGKVKSNLKMNDDIMELLTAAILKPTSNVVKLKMKYSDLEIIDENIGTGQFSLVQLVALKTGYAERSGLPEQKYALQCLSKLKLMEYSTISCIQNAQEAWKELDSPFILKLYDYFEGYNDVYFLLELNIDIIDLYSHLLTAKRIPENHTKFYVASILLAFDEMHSKKIACRNLMPESILIDSTGYIKLMKLRFAKKVHTGKTWTLCGSPDYLPPEMIMNEGHDWGVDYWALGILIYELINGSPPFTAKSEMDRYKNIISRKIDYPAQMSLEVQDIISCLLYDQSERIGRAKGGTKSVKQHLWFAGFPWSSVIDKSMKAPFIPDLEAERNGSEIANMPDSNIFEHTKKDTIRNSVNQNLDHTVSVLRSSIITSSGGRGIKAEKAYDTQIRRYSLEHNRFSSQIEDLKKFQQKHLKHMIVKNTSLMRKKCKSSSFSQFYLLSALPTDIGPLSLESSKRNYLDPFICKSIHVVDKYPEVTTLMDTMLSPEEVSSFCFPSGIKLRLIPRCALEKGAKRMVGEEGDKYQLHTFTDASGATQYGVSVTIHEVVTDKIDQLIDLRSRCKAIKTIQNFFVKSKSKGGKSINKKKKSNILNKIFRPRNHTDEKKDFAKVSTPKAKESYNTMLENDKRGDVCVAETCFILIGINSGEQSLMLFALKQLVQLYRVETDMLLDFGDVIHGSAGDHCERNRKSSRHWTLQGIKSKLYLSPVQSRVKYPNDEYEFISRRLSKLEFDPLHNSLPEISLPLPLPDMIGEFGVATLFLKFSSSSLLYVLHLILLESPVLVIGTSSEEVACCTSALLTLLEPFQWASVLMPLIPIEYLDFIESPVPFIGGLVPENSMKLRHVLADNRVTEAVNCGLIIINLDKGNIIAADQLSKEKKSAFSQTLSIHNRIFNYQNRLKDLAKKEASSLTSFTKFFEKGASGQEALTIHSLKLSIREHVNNLFQLDYHDEEQWKQYCDFDEVSQSHTFYPSKINSLFRNQFKFLDYMAQTQLFHQYLQKKKNPASKMKLDHPNALFIVDWLSFRWRQRNKPINYCT